jgi:hypothetical protein
MKERLMLDLSFDVLSQAYQRYGSLSTEQLYTELGWPELVGKNEWLNTCAVRMSLALSHNKVALPGQLVVKQGDLTGKRVIPGQNQLSDWLMRELGEPLRVGGNQDTKQSAVSGHRGIISFMRLPGYAGGHIDLLTAQNYPLICSRACYFEANEVRFWALT